MAAGKLYNHRERRAHPPLGAGAGVDHGVDVVITESHGNRAAPSGWMMRLIVRFGLSSPYSVLGHENRNSDQEAGPKELSGRIAIDW